MCQSRWNPGRWGAGCWQSRWLLGNHGDRAGGSDEAQTWWGSAEQLWLGLQGRATQPHARDRRRRVTWPPSERHPSAFSQGSTPQSVTSLSHWLWALLGLLTLTPGKGLQPPGHRVAPGGQGGTMPGCGGGKHGRSGRRGAGAGDEALRRIRGAIFVFLFFIMENSKRAEVPGLLSDIFSVPGTEDAPVPSWSLRSSRAYRL